VPGGAPDTEPPECHRRPSPTADFRRPSRSTGSRAILIVLSRPRVWRSGGTEGGVQRTDREKVCAVHLHGTAVYLISKYTSVLVAAFLPLCLCGYLISSYLILSWSWWSCHHASQAIIQRTTLSICVASVGACSSPSSPSNEPPSMAPTVRR
jgi:hypothetical protein